ncbi:conserved hypothetical protein [Histoplasma capsulatum var. duboisii H88]|uniref:DUF4048 domain-containing protein n=1 Tax=Ajellomyces capsulatus (strain H88) TaxID=544711 RepID=F0UP23_AJEC8|nr:conserved hypothetical protein [Histoplasma capsulatum var. duboisii H88]
MALGGAYGLKYERAQDDTPDISIMRLTSRTRGFVDCFHFGAFACIKAIMEILRLRRFQLGNMVAHGMTNVSITPVFLLSAAGAATSMAIFMSESAIFPFMPQAQRGDGRQLNVVLERFIVVQSGAGKTARCGPNLAPCHDAKVHCDAIDGVEHHVQLCPILMRRKIGLVTFYVSPLPRPKPLVLKRWNRPVSRDLAALPHSSPLSPELLNNIQISFSILSQNRETAMDEASTTTAPDLQYHAPNDASGKNTRLEKRASLPVRPNVAARHSKRLTLNFPITVSQSIGHSQTQPDQLSPASSSMCSATQPSHVIASPNDSSTSTPTLFSETNNDDYGFLTTLAAQERKVLELKEELQKAEAELVTLKRQWALVEKDRKRIDIYHHVEPLKPLKLADSNSLDVSNSPQTDKATTVVTNQNHARMSHELKRQSWRNSQSSSPGDSQLTMVSVKGRTVFQSSKHTRTLSLLSPSTSNSEFKPSFPQPKKIDGQDKTASSRPSSYPRSATLPSVDRCDIIRPTNGGNSTPATAEQKAQWRRTLPPIAQDVTAEALMRTGRQMASDFREGLWTFIEDIRQATVGEEGINGTESRSTTHNAQSGQRGMSKRDVGSGASTRTGRSTTPRGIMADSHSASGNDSTSKAQEISFWSEFGIDTPDQRTKSSPQDAENPSPDEMRQQKPQEQDPEDPSLQDVDDNWDMWDTPSKPKALHTPSSSSSTFHSNRDCSPSTDSSSPRTSARRSKHAHQQEIRQHPLASTQQFAPIQTYANSIPPDGGVGAESYSTGRAAKVGS